MCEHLMVAEVGKDDLLVSRRCSFAMTNGRRAKRVCSCPFVNREGTW